MIRTPRRDNPRAWSREGPRDSRVGNHPLRSGTLKQFVSLASVFWLASRLRAMNRNSTACVGVILVSALLGLAGCGSRTARSSSAPFPVTAEGTRPVAELGPIAFRDQELPFCYERGETGAAWPVETTGGGVGLLDYDGDGRLDLFFAQGGPLMPGKTAQGSGSSARPIVLLRNLGGGRFEDVSASVGLDAPGLRPGRGRGRLRRRRRPRRLRDPIRPQHPLAQRRRPIHRRHGRGRGRLRPLEPGRGLRRLRRRRRSRPVRGHLFRVRSREGAVPTRPEDRCGRIRHALEPSRASPMCCIATRAAADSPT